MFTIKIEHRGKVINLGKNVTSLDKIFQEVKIRFPVDFKYGVKCFLGQDLITDFQQLKKKAEDTKLVSIKLKVQPLNQKEFYVQEQSTSLKDQQIKKQMSPKIKIQTEDSKAMPLQQKSVSQIKKEIISQNSPIQIIRDEQILNTNQKDENRSLSLEKSVSSKKSNGSIYKSQKSIRSIQKVKKSLEKSAYSLKSQKQEQLKKSIVNPGSKFIKTKSICKSSSLKSFDEKSKFIEQKKPQLQKVIPIQGQILCFKCEGTKKVRKICSQCNVEGSPYENDVLPCSQCMDAKKFRYKYCPVCDGKGIIKQSDPLIALINNIAEKKLQNLLSKYKIISKSEEKIQEKRLNNVSKKFDLSKLKFEIIQVIKTKEKVNIGQKFNWNIQILNTGVQFPQKMQLYDEKDGFVCHIKKLKNNQSQVLKLGSMTFDKAGIHEKKYRIGFFSQDQSFEFLQKKFGFKVQVIKEQKKSLLTNNFRKRVTDLAKSIKNKHSIEYLIEKFRDMDISQQNEKQISNDILSDIITSLQFE